MRKTKQQIADEWCHDNGAAKIDIKEKDISLFDGGLFSVEAKKIKRHKIVGYKKLENGNTQVLFSKKRIVPCVDYTAIFWIEELDETIDYLKSMKKMLNGINMKTEQVWKKKLAEELKKGDKK